MMRPRAALMAVALAMAAASSGQAEQSKPAGETPVSSATAAPLPAAKDVLARIRVPSAARASCELTAHAGRRAGSNCARRASADRSRSSPRRPTAS